MVRNVLTTKINDDSIRLETFFHRQIYFLNVFTTSIIARWPICVMWLGVERLYLYSDLTSRVHFILKAKIE